MKSKMLRLLTVILVFLLSFVAPAASARSMPFVDVPQGAWFHDAVAWAHAHGLAAGTSLTTFSPHANVTRGQFVVFLHRIAGGQLVNDRIRFHDVANPSQYFFHSVNWASDNGIVSGVGNGSNFEPNRSITREEMAVILFRFARLEGRHTAAPESVLHRFPDRRNISGFAQDGMRWAANTGILRGDSSGRINPRNPATRAETIVVIRRYVFDEPFTPPPPPLAPPRPDGSHSIQQATGFPSPNRFIGRGGGWIPDMIVMHTTAGSASSAISTSFHNHVSNPTSYHFVICQFGTITQIVPITDGAWGNGTRVNTGCSVDHRFSQSETIRNRFTNANFYTVSIGFGDAGPTWQHTNGAITPDQVRAGAWLLQHIRYEIWDTYSITIPITRDTVIGHNEVTPRSTGRPPGGCPGPLFPFDTIINMANGWR